MFSLPFVLLAVVVIETIRFRRQTGAWKAAVGQRGPLSIGGWMAVSIIVLGALTFWVHWPLLYVDLVTHLREYIVFHDRHDHYTLDYFGFLYVKPPFPISYPLVMTLLTVPVGILVLGLIGVGCTMRRAWSAFGGAGEGRWQLDWLVLLNLIVPIAIIGRRHPSLVEPCIGCLPCRFWRCAGVEESWFGGCGPPSIKTTSVAVRCYRSCADACCLGNDEYGHQGPVYFNVLAGGPPGAARLDCQEFLGLQQCDALGPSMTRLKRDRMSFGIRRLGCHSGIQKSEVTQERCALYVGHRRRYSDWAVYHDQHEKMPEEADIWRTEQGPAEGHFVDGVQMIGFIEETAQHVFRISLSLVGNGAFRRDVVISAPATTATTGPPPRSSRPPRRSSRRGGRLSTVRFRGCPASSNSTTINRFTLSASTNSAEVFTSFETIRAALPYWSVPPPPLATDTSCLLFAASCANRSHVI